MRINYAWQWFHSLIFSRPIYRQTAYLPLSTKYKKCPEAKQLLGFLWLRVCRDERTAVTESFPISSSSPSSPFQGKSVNPRAGPLTEKWTEPGENIKVKVFGVDPATVKRTGRFGKTAGHLTQRIHFKSDQELCRTRYPLIKGHGQGIFEVWNGAAIKSRYIPLSDLPFSNTNNLYTQHVEVCTHT